MTPIDDANLMSITVRPELVMSHGSGSFIEDESGRRYLDLVQGWAVNVLGHAPAAIREALARQSARLLTPSPAFHNRPQLELARRLCSLCALDRVFFCSTGAEANEGAIKLARKWGRLHRDGAYEILTTEGGFHGRTLATMAASGKAGWDELFPPKVEGFRKLPFGDVDALRQAVRKETVAIMVEPIQGEAGVVVPPDGYLKALRSLADEQGLLLICDEVQTGMARTGPLFAHEREAIAPDIMTLGKGLGGGVPIAALLCRESVACFEPGEQGGTYNGNPLMTAVGLAVLDEITRPGFREHAKARADQLREGLERLAARFGFEGVRGHGHLVAMVLDEPIGPALVETARNDHALLINSPRPGLLRFMPALTIAEDEVAEALGRLEATIESVRTR